jgi:predicted DNA-binding ribbon-helix-helix protein
MQKRSIRIARHSTSISLEPEFWAELKRIAAAEKLSLNRLVAKIDAKRAGNLSSALRLYVLREIKSNVIPAKAGIQRER